MAKTIEKDGVKDAAKKAKTKNVHLFILLDESGSMNGRQEAVVTGCNEFLHEFKDAKGAKAWIAFFDKSPGEDRTRFKVKAKKIKDVSALTPDDYRPRGMTPLNDSILDSLEALDKKVGEDEGVFMAIITDGAENASEASAETVKAAIAKYEKRGWAFVYLGADHDVRSQAQSLGLGAQGQSFTYTKSASGIKSTTKRASGYAQAYYADIAAGAAPAQALASNNTLRSLDAEKDGGVIGEDEADEKE